MTEKRTTDPPTALWKITVVPNSDTILGFLRHKYTIGSRPIVETAQLSLEEDQQQQHVCKGCCGRYYESDTKDIDGVGKVCLNCIYHLATFVME